MSVVNGLFVIVTVLGAVTVALVAGVVFRSSGSRQPFKRGIALACSLTIGAMAGFGAAALCAAPFIGSGSSPLSPTGVRVFLGGLAAAALVGGCIVAWIVDRLIARRMAGDEAG
jgi:hypothetical protein